jgi:hypothetical protein
MTKIICIQHIHAGVSAPEVAEAVLADYANNPTTTEGERFYDMRQSSECVVETYPLSEVVDLAQVKLGRRRRRNATSFCTPQANIKKLAKTARVLVVYSYDPEQNGIRIKSAMPIREDANLNDESGDYYAEFGPRTVTNFQSYKLPDIREWYENRGYCLALSEEDWTGFKPQEA